MPKQDEARGVRISSGDDELHALQHYDQTGDDANTEAEQQLLEFINRKYDLEYASDSYSREQLEAMKSPEFIEK